MRIALGLGHLFLPFVAMPIYYYLYIWRGTPPERAASKAGQLREPVLSFLKRMKSERYCLRVQRIADLLYLCRRLMGARTGRMTMYSMRTDNIAK